MSVRSYLLCAVLFSGMALRAEPAIQEKPAVAGVPAATAAPAAKFDPGRDAAGDIRAALAEARRTNRRVLLDVGGEWCVWCRRLDSLFAGNRVLSRYLREHYVVVKVNYSKENKNEAVLSQYPKIPGYPHFFVLSGDGGLLKSQDTGELESGKGHDPAKVMAFLKKWAITRTRGAGAS